MNSVVHGAGVKQVGSDVMIVTSDKSGTAPHWLYTQPARPLTISPWFPFPFPLNWNYNTCFMGIHAKKK